METFQREEFKHFQYFITTHSNHFLDITLDSNNISVYTVEQSGSKNKKPTFTITNVENADTNVLALIGVQNSSVFLSNCTIWVEGITDRIYLRKYLEIIQKDKVVQYKEDTHFSFVEYGGNNITHWSFLDSDDPNHKNILVDRLCGKLFLITDNDSTGFKMNEQLPANATKKMKRLKQLQDKLGERFYCLAVREIENLLTPNVLKKVILDYEGRNGESDSINFSKLKYDNYKYKKIGNYIDSNVKYSNKQDLTRKYSSDSGTVNDKVNFAKKAVEYINDKNDISVDAIALTEKVLLFIENMNK
jgi:predicted ATP-dependent endonuclease of OLD family